MIARIFFITVLLWGAAGIVLAESTTGSPVQSTVSSPVYSDWVAAEVVEEEVGGGGSHTPTLPASTVFDIAFHTDFITGSTVENRETTPDDGDGSAQTAYDWELGYSGGGGSDCDTPVQGSDSIGSHLDFTSSGSGACLRLASGTNTNWLDTLQLSSAEWGLVVFASVSEAGSGTGSRTFFETRSGTNGPGIALLIDDTEPWMRVGNGSSQSSTNPDDLTIPAGPNIFVYDSEGWAGHNATLDLAAIVPPAGLSTAGDVAKISCSDSWNTSNCLLDDEKLSRLTFTSGPMNAQKYAAITNDYIAEFPNLCTAASETIWGCNKATISGLQIHTNYTSNYTGTYDVAIEDCDGNDIVPTMAHDASDPASYAALSSGTYGTSGSDYTGDEGWDNDEWEMFENWHNGSLHWSNDPGNVANSFFFNFGSEKDICRVRLVIHDNYGDPISGITFEDESGTQLTISAGPSDLDDFDFHSTTRRYFSFYLSD